MAIKKTSIHKYEKEGIPLYDKDAPLEYAPTNEQGVVVLFSYLLKKYGLKIKKIRSGYPDCIASEIRGSGKDIRIEFEFQSHSFQGHDPKGCDLIVCWEDDWPKAPKKFHDNIVELRKEFGLGFNVWIKSLAPKCGKNDWEKELSTLRKEVWTAPRQAHKGDLILFYLTHPKKCIEHIYVVKDDVYQKKTKWGRWYALADGVCLLKTPIFLSDLRAHPILKTANFVRGNCQGHAWKVIRWPDLYALIVKHNPSIKAELKKFAPENLD